MTKFDTSLKPEDLTRQKIKENTVGAIIEKQKLVYREGDFNRREYHAVTRGWILNEIVRRADKTGRTVGEILRADICEPLGGVDAFVGLSAPEMKRVAPVKMATIGYLVNQSMKPKKCRKIDMSFSQLLRRGKYLKKCLKKMTRRKDHPE